MSFQMTVPPSPPKRQLLPLSSSQPASSSSLSSRTARSLTASFTASASSSPTAPVSSADASSSSSFSSPVRAAGSVQHTGALSSPLLRLQSQQAYDRHKYSDVKRRHGIAASPADYSDSDVSDSMASTPARGSGRGGAYHHRAHIVSSDEDDE
jgi:hypothetical protein